MYFSIDSYSNLSKCKKFDFRNTFFSFNWLNLDFFFQNFIEIGMWFGDKIFRDKISSF